MVKARQRLVPVVAPNAFGNNRYGDPSGVSYWGEQNTNEDAAGFAGTIILLAAATGLGLRRRFPQERLAWLALAGALAVIAMPPALERALAPLPLPVMGAREACREVAAQAALARADALLSASAIFLR